MRRAGRLIPICDDQETMGPARSPPTHPPRGAGHYPGDLTDGQWLGVRGIPAAGEYELRTSPAMLITDRLVGGGSVHRAAGAEFQGRRGGDGPRWPGPSGDQRQPADTARAWCLPGQARLGVSVEFDVKHGPVTVFGIAQQRDAASGSSPRRGAWWPVRCYVLATPRPGWISAVTRGSGRMRGRFRHIASLGTWHRKFDA